MGVTSSMLPIFIPLLARDLTTDCAPCPGILDPCPPGALILMFMFVTPFSIAVAATLYAACIAAYGDPSSWSALTTIPPLPVAIVSHPDKSVSVIIVLFFDDIMCATPHLIAF